MEHKENQRVVLTKRMLKEAMLELLKEKQLSQINVSELCRVAGINRATFYKHYAIPQDVLREIEGDVVTALRKLAPTENTPETARKYLEDICSYLYNSRDLMRILLTCKTDEDLREAIGEINRRFWGRYRQQNPGLDEAGTTLMVTFYSSGAYYMMRQWLLEDVDKTPSEVADLVVRMGKWS